MHSFPKEQQPLPNPPRVPRQSGGGAVRFKAIKRQPPPHTHPGLPCPWRGREDKRELAGRTMGIQSNPDQVAALLSPGLVPGVNGAEGDGSGAAAGLGHKGQNTAAPRGTDGDRGESSRGDTGREGTPPRSASGYRRASGPDPCGCPPHFCRVPPFPRRSPPIPVGAPSPFGGSQLHPPPRSPQAAPLREHPCTFRSCHGQFEPGDVPGRVPPVHPRCPGAGGRPRPGVAAAGLRAAPSRRCGPSERTMSPVLFN